MSVKSLIVQAAVRIVDRWGEDYAVLQYESGDPHTKAHWWGYCPREFGPSETNYGTWLPEDTWPKDSDGCPIRPRQEHLIDVRT